METLKNIIKYVLVIILTLLIISYIILNIASNTIFKETYILSKLKDTNYYEQTYNSIKDKFENYINQSGLEKEVLEGIITEEKIEKDTNIIISNIYNGLGEKISTQEIKNNLNKNIENFLKNRSLNKEEQKAIETFVQTICDEYTQSIAHFEFENTVNDIYKKITKSFEIIQKLLLIFIGICIIILLLLNVKRIYKYFTQVGISLLSSGFFLLATKIFVNANVKIQNIELLSNAFTNTLINILNEILKSIMIYSFILLLSGVVFAIIPNLIHNIKKYKKHKIHENEG